ncbi:unnamed protein product [Musa acuminata subsp. malaccensis]|uniref:(wild Malaysian banana) hypothetical protein n=1 Tax=Musa acuminata subsp. malaccensis TaxID=214687 RepID=A0A804K758_MUSAM|nr:unnamed protein product [Musa acuminata subsp. malaccensis]
MIKSSYKEFGGELPLQKNIERLLSYKVCLNYFFYKG